MAREFNRSAALRAGAAPIPQRAGSGTGGPRRLTPCVTDRLWLAALLLALVLAGSVRAQVPQLIHYQGRVTKNSSNLDGPGQFKFSFVNSNGTVTFWSNDGTGSGGREPDSAVSMLVDKGAFSVTLGDTSLTNMTPVPPTVFTNSDVRLRIWFTDGEPPLQLLSPDQRITAVGYAMLSATVPDGAITGAKLAPGSVTAANIAPGSVGTAQLADRAVTLDKLAPGAIPPPEVPDGSVTSNKLAAGAVTTMNLAENAVTSSKVAAGAITADKIAAGSIGSKQLASGAVGSSHLAAGAVLANLLASGQSGVANGGVVLSFDGYSASLIDAGYTRAGSFSLTPDRWGIRSLPGTFFPSVAVWSGTELIAIGDELNGPGFPGGRYDLGTDTWRLISNTGAPSRRSGPVAVWTGGEAIIWGGTDLQDGYIYRPPTDSWRPMTTNGAPTVRREATAIWTGAEMLVWGGIDPVGVELNTGGAYDPVRNLWRPISTLASPSARRRHSAVWTGEEMIIWGGQAGPHPAAVFKTGGRYRPSTDTWTNTSTMGAPPTASAHAAIWTGTEMIVWGGDAGGGFSGPALRTGGRFNPGKNSWRPVSSMNAPLARFAHSAIWTGSEMLVWGGVGPLGGTETGGRYHPATDEWISMASAPLPGSYNTRAIWTGNAMLIPVLDFGNARDRVMLLWQPPVTAYLYQR